MPISSIARPQTVSQFSNADGNDADTYGWDTAFAINFTNANAAVTANWANVDAGAKNLVQAASDDPSFNIDAVLGPWQLTLGGDGKNIRMACPVTSGTYNAMGTAIAFPTTAGQLCQVIVEIGMEWVPNPGQFHFVVTGNTEVTAIETDLDANTLDQRLRTEFQTNGKTLSSAATALLITAGKEWTVTDGKATYYLFATVDKFQNKFLNVYQYEGAWKNDLKALADAASASEPAVAIITITNNPATGIPADVLPALLSDWFNAKIGAFNHVFASLDLSPIVAQSDKFAWMKPTATSYAVTDEGTMDSSVFGVLTMALNAQPADNHQVSPYAIPTGSDSGFLIAGTRFMQNMLLAGAQTIFNDAPASSFIITNDGLTVTNTQDMVWGKFMMDNKKNGSVADNGFSAQLDAGTLSDGLKDALRGIGVGVSGLGVTVTSKGSQWLLSTGNTDDDEYILNLDGTNIDVFLATALTIAKGQFSMSLIHSYVQIQFIDIKYSYSSDFDVHVNYTENVQLQLQDAAGKKIFWFNQIMKNMVVNVTKTKSAITREIVEDAVAGALALVAIGGPILEGLGTAADVGEVTEDGGEAIIDEEAFENVEADNPDEAEANDEDAGNNAAEQSGGKMTNIKNAFQTPKWKFVAKLAALAGAVAGLDPLIDAIIEAAARKQWENVPGFDDFSNAAILPYTWPNVAGFNLTSAALAGSLQIGLTVKST